jgi:hypothetical protein
LLSEAKGLHQVRIENRTPLRHDVASTLGHQCIEFVGREDVQVFVPNTVKDLVRHIIRRETGFAKLAVRLPHRSDYRRALPVRSAHFCGAVTVAIDDPGSHPARAQYRGFQFCILERQLVGQRFGNRHDGMLGCVIDRDVGER